MNIIFDQFTDFKPVKRFENMSDVIEVVEALTT